MPVILAAVMVAIAIPNASFAQQKKSLALASPMSRLQDPK